MRNVRALLVVTAMVSLTLGSAPSVFADDGVALTAAQETCLKKALTAAEFEQFLANPFDLGLKDKAKSCQVSGGSGNGTGGAVVKPGKVATTGNWITANPFDLSHVTAISVFRSCSGHDYSGTNISGQPESDRSMKHYIQTDIPWTSTGSLKGFAPFAGTVTVTSEQFPLGKQVAVTSPVTGWQMVYFHGDPQVKNGAKVKAGQAVIAWPPSNAPAVIDQLHPEGTSFDVALRAADGRYMDSPLLHMAPKVAKAWSAKGFTPARAIVSKTARDAAPCNATYNATDATDWVRAN